MHIIETNYRRHRHNISKTQHSIEMTFYRQQSKENFIYTTFHRHDIYRIVYNRQKMYTIFVVIFDVHTFFWTAQLFLWATLSFCYYKYFFSHMIHFTLRWKVSSYNPWTSKIWKGFLREPMVYFPPDLKISRSMYAFFPL